MTSLPSASGRTRILPAVPQRLSQKRSWHLACIPRRMWKQTPAMAKVSVPSLLVCLKPPWNAPNLPCSSHPPNTLKWQKGGISQVGKWLSRQAYLWAQTAKVRGSFVPPREREWIEDLPSTGSALKVPRSPLVLPKQHTAHVQKSLGSGFCGFEAMAKGCGVPGWPKVAATGVRRARHSAPVQNIRRPQIVIKINNNFMWCFKNQNSFNNPWWTNYENFK